MTATRIDARFKALSAEGRAGLVTFVTAGDPDYETSLAIVKAFPSPTRWRTARRFRLRPCARLRQDNR